MENVHSFVNNDLKNIDFQKEIIKIEMKFDVL